MICFRLQNRFQIWTSSQIMERSRLLQWNGQVRSQSRRVRVSQNRRHQQQRPMKQIFIKEVSPHVGFRIYSDIDRLFIGQKQKVDELNY